MYWIFFSLSKLICALFEYTLLGKQNTPGFRNILHCKDYLSITLTSYNVVLMIRNNNMNINNEAC